MVASSDAACLKESMHQSLLSPRLSTRQIQKRYFLQCTNPSSACATTLACLAPT